MFRGFAQASPRGLSDRNSLNVKLRHQAITFVSASSNTPAEPEEEQESAEQMVGIAGQGEDEEDEDDESEESEISLEGDGPVQDLKESTVQTNITTDVEIAEGVRAQMNIQSSPNTADMPGSPEQLPFFVDTEGDRTLGQAARTNGKQPMPRNAVCTPTTTGPAAAAGLDEMDDGVSDSSEEVVFHGRSRPTIIDDPVKPPSSQPSHAPHVTDGLLAALEAPATISSASSSSPAKGWGARPSKFEQQPASQDWQPAPAIPYWKKGKGKQRPDLGPSPAERMMLEDTPARETRVMFAEPAKDNEVGAEDTIASLQADWKQALKEKKMAKDTGSSAQESSKASRRGKRGRKKDNRQLRSAIVSDGEDDAEAAYDDYMANLIAQAEEESDNVSGPSFTPINIASLSVSGGGPSLVVDGRQVADDEVLIRQAENEWESDDSSESEGPIGQDLSDLSDEGPLDYSDLESSDLEDQLEYTEREQWEDEEDIRQRRQDAMTDEQIARLFAKQQDLGIDVDELIIDDGMYINTNDGVGDLDEARAGLREISNSSFARSANRNGMRRSHRKNNELGFPDASALADTVEQYGENGFDIMDFDRPSLRPTKKGRKGKLPPELEALSDEELRDGMLGAWEKDRSKKRLKKAEREELRAQGLLGVAGRKGKADLSQKYVQGMTMQQVHEELRVFLLDDGQNSRSFPPMDKGDRKALHEVATAFNLNSKSVGSGKNRFPVLYKTARTLEYSEAHFEKVMDASSRGFLKNSAGRAKKAAKAVKSMNGRAGRGGGFDKSTVSLRNGEVVGGGAAELGTENKGHRLMEKMGWTKGTALGKDGEGLLLPVAQVMRAGKAGLG